MVKLRLGVQPVDTKKCGYAALAIALCLVVFAGEYFVYYSDAFEYDAEVHWNKDSIEYQVESSGSDVYDAVLFDNNGEVSVTELAIYVNESYSKYYDRAYELAGIPYYDQDYFASQLLIALDNRGFEGGFECDSGELCDYIKSTLDNPVGCGIIVTSYSLPAEIYTGSEDNLLIQWMKAGGTLYWTGSVVGGFCVGDDGLHEISDSQELFFGKECVYTGSEAVATQTIDNGFTEALSLKTGNLSYGLCLDGMVGALALGYKGEGVSTIGMVPLGNGSVCVFSGLFDIDLVDDIGQIISAGVTSKTVVAEHHVGEVTRSTESGSFEKFDEGCHVYIYIGGTYTKFGEAFHGSV